jgi:hypothetical protein
MTCEQAMSEYFDLDRGESPAGTLADHLRSCPNCSSLVLKIDSGLEILSEQTLRRDAERWPEAELRPELFVQSVMARVREESAAVDEDAPEEQNLLSRWIVVGVIILAAIPLSSFSDSLSWLSQLIGSRLDFPLHLVLGLAFTIYALFFIGSHLKELSRRLHLKPPHTSGPFR